MASILVVDDVEINIPRHSRGFYDCCPLKGGRSQSVKVKIRFTPTFRRSLQFKSQINNIGSKGGEAYCRISQTL